MPRSAKPPRTGQGALTIARENHPIAFEVWFVDVRGQRSAKGGVTGAPEAMREAFRQGRVKLALDDGATLDVAIIAHAEGSDTAYFESHGAR